MENTNSFYHPSYLTNIINVKSIDDIENVISTLNSSGLKYSRIVLSFGMLKSIANSKWYSEKFKDVTFTDLTCEGGTVSGAVLKSQHVRQVLANHFNMEICCVSSKHSSSISVFVPYIVSDISDNILFLDCGESTDKFSLVEFAR